ncbi:STAS domain-containing protein [Paraglaciecola sp.]|uniref:STAS domain-containing protein n=1 Tax=Paraglaciecola sp. TaxID=1920173 RepID=UPI0030F3E677
MPIKLSNKADFTVVECDGDMTIFNVREDHEQLLSLVAKTPEKLIVDLTALQDFDSAGLQLMLWLKQTLPHSSVMISAGDNEVVQKLLELYRLDSHFDAKSAEIEES